MYLEFQFVLLRAACKTSHKVNQVQENVDLAAYGIVALYGLYLSNPVKVLKENF